MIGDINKKESVDDIRSVVITSCLRLTETQRVEWFGSLDLYNPLHLVAFEINIFISCVNVSAIESLQKPEAARFPTQNSSHLVHSPVPGATAYSTQSVRSNSTLKSLVFQCHYIRSASRSLAQAIIEPFKADSMYKPQQSFQAPFHKF